MSVPLKPTSAESTSDLPTASKHCALVTLSKTAKKAGAKLTDGFGWLQADMRMPLPSWEELQQACHLVGDHNGHFMYLCASPQQDSTLETCEISEDFTQYYKNTVYVCAGAKVSSRRMSGGVHTGL